MYEKSFYKSSLLFLLFVFIILFSGASQASMMLVEQIKFEKINKMELKQTKDDYIFDIQLGVTNLSNHNIRFKNCRFYVYFAPPGEKYIPIGRVKKEVVILDKSLPEDPYINKVNLKGIPIENIDQLHMDIITSEKMQDKLASSNPKLNIRIDGTFEMDTQFSQGWIYQQKRKIDWVVTMNIPRDIMIQTFKVIEKKANDYRKEKGMNIVSSEKDASFLDEFEEEEK